MKHLLPFLLLVFPSVLTAQSPLFIGHRGASYLAPENTLAAYERAWEIGVTAAECDIMLTADNKIIVFHDKTGKRLTGNNFVVNESSYNEIKDFPIKLNDTNEQQYQGQTIPLLEDLLYIIPENCTLVIEIKTGPEIMSYLKEVLENNWKTGNLVFIAFDFETILAAKNSYPDIPCYYLSSFKHDVLFKYKTIKESKLDGVDLRHAIINKRMVNKFTSVGKDVWCWTVNEPAVARKMAEFGVTGITTDRPGWLENNFIE